MSNLMTAVNFQLIVFETLKPTTFGHPMIQEYVVLDLVAIQLPDSACHSWLVKST
jgi:hypothetical protein